MPPVAVVIDLREVTMCRWIVILSALVMGSPCWADSDGWGGWAAPIAPMVAVTPPAILLPQITISPAPLWGPPPVIYYGPRYGYAPYGYAERHHGGHHRHHHHDRD
jgi:hypothetical protein